MSNFATSHPATRTGAQATRADGKLSRLRMFLLLATGLTLLLLASLAVLGASGLILYQSELILPGVSVMGIEVGGQSRTTAAETLASAWEQRQIVVTADDTAVALTAADLGFELNREQTLEQAYWVGRRPDSLDTALRALSSGYPVEPVWQLNSDTAAATFARLGPAFFHSPGEPNVHISEGRAIVTVAEQGRALDEAASLAQLLSHGAETLQTGRLALVMQPVEPTASGVDNFAADLNERLAHTLTVAGFDPVRNEQMSWSVPPAVWAEWLEISAAPDSAEGFVWQLAETHIDAKIQEINAALAPDRYLERTTSVAAVADAIRTQQYTAQVRVWHHDRQHVVQFGETLSSIGYDYGIPYPWIQAANPDLSDSLSAGQTITIPSPDTLLPLPPVQNKRIVVSISDQQMWAYENGQVKWEWPVSTGIASSPTAPGVFQIQSHEVNAYASNWDLWMPHFMGIYRPVPSSDFMNGFHGFPTRGGQNLLWTSSLGTPVTYGCILISSENAALLFDWAEDGVIVDVQR